MRFNLQGELSKQRKNISEQMGDSEEIEETWDLTPGQMTKKMQLTKESLQLLDQEETYWMNRCN